MIVSYFHHYLKTNEDAEDIIGLGIIYLLTQSVILNVVKNLIYIRKVALLNKILRFFIRQNDNQCYGYIIPIGFIESEITKCYNQFLLFT